MFTTNLSEQLDLIVLLPEGRLVLCLPHVNFKFNILSAFG